MNTISVEVIVGIAALILAALVIYSRTRRPSEKTFKCGRCSKITPHTPRTIEAWRSGKTRYFCNACHALWLQSQPAQARHRGTRPGGAGCLSIVFALMFLPVLLICAWWAYA